MKKSNIITLLFLCISIIAVMLFMKFKNAEPVDNNNTEISQEVSSAEDSDNDKTEENNMDLSENNDSSNETNSETNSENSSDNEVVTPPPTEPETPSEPANASMDDALFIGDSRTVGLMEYSNIQGADFFYNVGMSVFNIQKETVSIPDLGKVSISQLLDSKDYSKIYVMLGVNEMGYKFEKIVDKYSELINFIEDKEPEASVIILANLHVTKSRSDTDDTFNNASINRLNEAISKFANNDNVFYLDSNILFDDADGALSADKSADNAHLYAKYYEEWGNWIINQTAALIGDN